MYHIPNSKWRNDGSLLQIFFLIVNILFNLKFNKTFVYFYRILKILIKMIKTIHVTF